ncbi:MAG: PKD domain-containing protein, partial [Acidobacteria bacterium]|nr:PKD domain-containing protein [Acidobacteriota bacterium]
GAGGAAGGAGVAGGDGDGGAPRNPPTAVLSISPTGTGMAEATQYRFDASGSTDPDRDTLTFTWDFGDGSQGMGVTTTHAYAAGGAYTVTLTVSDGREQTTATGSVTVAPNLDGGRFVGSGEVSALDPVLELTQTGSGLSGRFSRETSSTNSARRSWTISGRLTDPDDFVCPCGLSMTFQGATTGTTDQEYRGTVRDDASVIELDIGDGGGAWVFTRQ